MKKISALILAAALVFSLAACGSGEGSASGPDEESSTTVVSDGSGENTPTQPPDGSEAAPSQSSDGETPAQSPEIGGEAPVQPSGAGFAENPDLKVVAAFMYDGNIYAVTENVGSKPILNYSIAYITFDNNGFVTTTDPDGYEHGRDEAANIMPGAKHIAGWFESTGSCAAAVIRSVDYADGTSWEASQLNQWAEQTRSSFQVEEYKAGIAALKEIAPQAESNEYAVLSGVYMSHGNQFSTSSDLHFTVQNTSEQGITRVTVYVLEFDANGFPVSVSPYDTYCLNGHQTGGTVNLAAGQSGDYSSGLFLNGSTTQIKAVISTIDFQDGTIWENPYIYEWILANNSSY